MEFTVVMYRLDLVVLVYLRTQEQQQQQQQQNKKKTTYEISSNLK